MSAPHIEQLLEQADACLERNQPAEAYRLYAQACSTDPGNTDAWMMLGALQGEMGAIDEAQASLEQSLRLDPDNAQAHHILGRLLLAQELVERSASHFREAVRLEPADAEAWNLLAAVEGRLERYPEAAQAGRQAVTLAPASVEAHMNLAQALRNLDQPEAAAEQFRLVTRLAPSLADAWAGLATLDGELGHIEQALEEYRTALALQPDHPEALCGESRLQILRGDHDSAYRRLQPLIQAGKADANIAIVYASLSGRYGEHREAIALLEEHLAIPGLSPALRSRLHFSLGKLHDASQAHEAAFHHYEQANRLSPHARRDLVAHQQFFEALKKTYTPDFVRTMPRAPSPGELPVFIVGMPRSGTTLVEQILASHSRVHGAGERRDIAQLALALPGELDDPRPYPLCMPALDADTAQRLARTQQDRLLSLQPDADILRVTDKMPHNFLHLGLINQLFPGARVIHCVRDPLDTCLSCYFSDFARLHEYSYDLHTLGNYFGLYRDLMSHWRSVLDQPMLDVSYERLVEDPDSVIQEILDFCDLPWEEGCLRFHETPRTITTLSHDQVRQPLYASSIGRWKHYESHIGALKSALETN